MSSIWPVVRLADVSTKVGSGATPKGGEASYQEDGVPFIRSMNVVFFGFKRNGLTYLNTEQAEVLRGAEVRANDILLNITGASIGRVTRAPEDLDGARVNQHVCIIRPQESMEPRFLQAYLSSPEFQDLIKFENFGVTRQALTKGQILEFELPLPPLNEQRRIADKLDVLLAQVDACRERLDRVSAIVNRFRQAVLAAATSGSLGGNAPTAGLLPLRSALDGVFTGPFGSALHKADYVEGGVPVINPMHINRGLITPSTDVAVSHEKAAELAEFKLQAGDVIVARRGVMGRCAVVAENQAGWLCGTGSMVLRPNAKLDPDFLQMFISSPATVAALDEAAVGSTMANLNQGILLALELWLPAVEQQRRIVNEARRLFSYADRLEQRIQATRARVERLTPALLAKAFRGELVPQDPNDESAEVLLERLRQTASNGETKRRPGRKSASR